LSPVAPLTNAQLSELLARAAEEEDRGGNRERALGRAARAAYFWPVEAWTLVEADRSLTELRSIGPWLERVVHGWIADPSVEVPAPPPLRSGFLTMAEASETLAADTGWMAGLHADLQMHTTYSDGAAPLPVMAEAADAMGYEFVAVTDHSKGLKIAGGMDEEELAEQGAHIALVNRELEERGSRLLVLRSIEMNLSPQGEQDMDPDALARLDLVLAAFHSNLRSTEDQTERYVKALRNPTFHVLAHPRCRMFNLRAGLQADWEKVFAVAAEEGKGLEIDAHPNRQDLDVDLLRLAREAGIWISIGTDAHSVGELEFIGLGVAAAIRAGLRRDRILNYRTGEEVLAWARGQLQA
jgi:histidinol phosphatase-like PHP family hydrolase